MREYVRRTIAELEQEIADLTKARDALLRLDTKAPTPEAAPRARRAKPRTAKPAAGRKPAPAKDGPAEGTADEVSETGVRILKFLDKNGPTRAEGIATGTKPKPNIVAIGLNKLVRDGLAEDNDGFFRGTDKGFDLALA